MEWPLCKGQGFPVFDGPPNGMLRVFEELVGVLDWRVRGSATFFLGFQNGVSFGVMFKGENGEPSRRQNLKHGAPKR